jgi:ribosome-binding ATPase YchF (GTP1/OBG family)
VTFLTAGDKESRAWEVHRGATAPEAAGAIHSDFQRGFIRAEVIAYEDLVTAGSWQQAKSKSLIRQEGKAYVVKEGDVVEFRFAV